MKKLLRQLPKAMLLLLVMLAFVQVNGQKRLVPAAPTAATDFKYTIENDVQLSDHEFQFDLYILDTDASQDFQLSIIQGGIFMNTAVIAPGATITAEYVIGSSELSASSLPTSATYAAYQTARGIIKLGPKAAPGCALATIVSTVAPGTRIATIKISSTLPFPESSQAGLAFSFAAPYASSVYYYPLPCGVSTKLTTSAANCYPGTSYGNIYLNAPVPPAAFAVTGGGSYCVGGSGMPVGLAGSEVGVTYTLYRGITPLAPTKAGDGLPLDFGDQIGTYTYYVKGTKGTMTTDMTGSALVTEMVCTPTWSGLVNNDWLNPGNWLGGTVPGASDDAIIPLGCPNYPIIDELVHVHTVDVYGNGTKSTLAGGMTISGEIVIGGNLNIKSTGSVDVTADGALTIDGDLDIVGNLLIESQGSMITNGGVSGTATVQRYINNDMAWHFLSSPVSNQPICNGVFAPTYPGTFPGNILTWDFYNWLPGECDGNLNWRNLRKETGSTPNNVDFPLLAFQDSRGYLVAYGAGWGTTKSFIGTPNTADRSLAFYDVTNACSWALPGNPFPSAVAWSGVTLKENLIAPYYYIWNDVTQNYEWWGDDMHFGGLKIDGNIPSMQGFFVRIDPAGTLHLNIPNDARVHDNATDTWIKSEPANRLSLKIENGSNYNDISYIMFEDNCNVGQDRKDAEKLFSLNKTDVPQIYTIINNDLKACSNSLPYVNNGTTIPVGFVAPVTGNYSITVDGIANFSSLTGLSLEDLELNVNQNLLQNPVYNFTSTGKEDAGRFLLHFAGPIGINDLPNSTITIFSNEKTVFINNAPNAQVTISNLLGQEILTTKLSDLAKNQVKVNATKGYYIVKVQGESSVKTAKVYIN